MSVSQTYHLLHHKSQSEFLFLCMIYGFLAMNLLFSFATDDIKFLLNFILDLKISRYKC